MFTVFQLIFILLAAIGFHRIYNYETLFTPWRSFIAKCQPCARMLLCPPCNALWILSFTAAFDFFAPRPWGEIVLTPFVLYPFLRSVVWFYQQDFRLSSPLPQPATIAIPTQPLSVGEVIPATPPAAKECAPCEAAKKRAEELKIEHAANIAYEKRFVIMTPMFSNFHPSYSLTSVVIDQARMLSKNPKWLVQIWVTTVCDTSSVPADLPSNVQIMKALPPIPLTDDYIDEKAKKLFAEQVMPKLFVLGNATIIAHDLLFVSSYLTIASAIHETLGTIAGFTWFHVAHSAPASIRPNDPKIMARATLPAGHKLLCLSLSQASAFATYYDTNPANVLVMPNARDIRSLLGASPRMWDFISRHQLLDADIVQIFPLSTPRADAKGLGTVIKVFAQMAKTRSVRLIVANAHANQNEAILFGFKKLAEKEGLPAESLVFVSESYPELAAYGLPTADLQMLFQVGNVFLFPTISEACSMTLMEAAASGALLVLNASTPSLFDIIPAHDTMLNVRWGSLVETAGPSANPSDVATWVVQELEANPMNRTKRSILKSHNIDALSIRLQSLVSGNA